MAADTLAVSAFNTLLGQYNNSTTGIQLGSIAIAKELFMQVASVSVAVLGLNRLLSKNVDATDTYIELIRLILYLNVFYLFVNDFPTLLQVIVNSFKQAAFYMGNMIGQVQTMGSTASTNFNFVQATNPGNIFDQGVTIATTILTNAFHKFSFLDFGMSLIAVLTAAVVLYCFGCVAIKVVLIEISSKIILGAGIFLLAFSGSQWTRDYATRYINSFFSIGIQMMFTYLLVGIGSSLTSQWANLVNNMPKGQAIETYVAVIMAAFVYYKLCLTLPEQATSYLAGGLAINPGQPPSMGKAMAVAAIGVGLGLNAVKGLGANTVGTVKSINALNKTAHATHQSKIKTLGDASKSMVVDKWNSIKTKVHESADKTAPGKLAGKMHKINDDYQNKLKQINPNEHKEGSGI